MFIEPFSCFTKKLKAIMSENICKTNKLHKTFFFLQIYHWKLHWVCLLSCYQCLCNLVWCCREWCVLYFFVCYDGSSCCIPNLFLILFLQKSSLIQWFMYISLSCRLTHALSSWRSILMSTHRLITFFYVFVLFYWQTYPSCATCYLCS